MRGDHAQRDKDRAGASVADSIQQRTHDQMAGDEDQGAPLQLGQRSSFDIQPDADVANGRTEQFDEVAGHASQQIRVGLDVPVYKVVQDAEGCCQALCHLLLERCRQQVMQAGPGMLIEQQ
jgi:hypothetical protein